MGWILLDCSLTYVAPVTLMLNTHVVEIYVHTLIHVTSTRELARISKKIR